MTQRIAINDLKTIHTLDRAAQARLSGRGVASSYLFMAPPPGRPQPPVFNQFLSIEKFEVNNYETHNYIDKMIQQTVNQNQLNLVSVQAGDGPVSVSVNQAAVGSNATS